MKIKKIFRTFLLFSLLMGAIGVQKTRALGTPQITSINPSSPTQVGACISIRARVDWDSEFRSMRIRFGNDGWQESSEIEFERNFCTNNYSPGWYTIRVEVAGQGDNDWSNPRVAEAQYELTGQPEPSKGPSINLFKFSPSDGAIVGDLVNIHIKVDSNNPGATKINVDCGGVSKIETSEVEFDSNWNTSGCPAEAVNVLICSRAVDDPNWTNATCSTRSFTLSSPQVAKPVPTAQFWSDSKQVLNGQCTYLHWQTSNADRVDIDGDTVQFSGDQEVCPPVTKKYTLSATNQSGSANRNLTIIVSSQPLSQNVADNFQTGNVIQIGYDIFVIVNDERKLVPNPETLDALGISRDWIDNKGYSDSDLKTIPLGQDIPDVNRDPSGFAAFKNKYFPNTTPIAPGIDPPAPSQPQEPNNSSSGQWQVGARVELCAGAQIRSGSGFSYPTHTIVPENSWQVDIIDGPRNNGDVTWWNISRKNIDGGGTGWIYFEQAGAGNCGTVLGENIKSNPPEVQTQPEATEPPSSDCGGFLVDCVQASEMPTPKICKPEEQCGFLDYICGWRNFWLRIENRGCINTLPSPTSAPVQQQPTNVEEGAAVQQQPTNVEGGEATQNSTLELSVVTINQHLSPPITLSNGMKDYGEYDCFVAAMSMALEYFKAQNILSRETITDYRVLVPIVREKQGRQNPGGTLQTNPDFVSSVTNNKLSASVSWSTPENLSIAIETELKAGRPVVAAVPKMNLLAAHRNGEGHAILVYGLHDGRVYYVDPWNGGRDDMSIQDFVNADTFPSGSSFLITFERP